MMLRMKGRIVIEYVKLGANVSRNIRVHLC